jgi:RES domain
VIGGVLRAAAGAVAQRIGVVSHRVWRVGHAGSPLDYVPHEYCSWQHRFDDPQRQYRTIYGAQHRVTALREVLADLRPEAKVRADFARFQLDQGIAVDELKVPAREVTAAWRQAQELAPARIERDGRLIDLDRPALLEELATRHATLLAEHGMAQLNISEIRSKNRPVTQAISRDLYERGAAGLLFRSNQDDAPCVVLLEGRARFVADGSPISLTNDVPDLALVCSEYNLVLKSAVIAGGGLTLPAIWRP